MRRFLAVLLAAVLCASACQPGSTGSGSSASPGATGRPPVVDGVPTSAGTHKLDLDVGTFGHREYLLHVPRGLPSRKVALVLAMHGGLSNMSGMEKLSGFDALSDRYGFLVAYPDGFMTTWNAGDCCGAAKIGNIDDVGFLSKLIDKLVGTGLVDPRRVYATGFSNGAGMAYRLACEASGKLAGIGVVEGALVTPCHPDHKLSVIIFHGTADGSVPFAGGGNRDFNDRRPFPPVSFAVNFWRKANGVSGLRAASLPTAANTDCQVSGGALAVAFCKVTGGTHHWYGDTAAVLWRFFAARPSRT